jgi:hypothetical protein
MKKLTILGVIIMLLLLPVMSACKTDSSETRTYILQQVPPPTNSAEAADDLVITPGGSAYRANVHEQGVQNPWSPIVRVKAVLGNGSDILSIYYRDNIETKAGETRNNIIIVIKEGSMLDSSTLALYAVAVPDGIALTNSMAGGLPGTLAEVVAVQIKPQVAPGQYNFKIGIEVDGKDYGTIPCTIKVIQ